MFWDEQCRVKKLEETRQIQIKENIMLKGALLKTFPIVKWCDMIKQTDYLITDDNCTHYMDNNTKFIYSWDSHGEEWIGPYKPFELNHNELKNLCS